MGTVAVLDLAGDLSAADAAQLAGGVFAWLHDVDERFSTYKPDSEVCRLGRGEISLEKCSDDMRWVMDQCAQLWRDTDGYFDIWATGRLDPSGFVKGWSVQVASEMLTEAGLTDHCIEVGGDLQTRGRPAADEQWRIGVRHPWQADKVCWILAGTDLAVATSGTYERGEHLINPRLGRPAKELCSVTVVGRDLGPADAYATAALAMGEGGLDWLARLPEHSAGVITSDGRCFRSADLPISTGDRSVLDDRLLNQSLYLPQGSASPARSTLSAGAPALGPHEIA